MRTEIKNHFFDVIIIGSGVSGSVMAYELGKKGLNCLMLEAGEFFSRSNFPKKEIDGNSKLYWSGGAEFNQTANLALLRPKVVGGGSIVNQALLDRFDQNAWDDFKRNSGVNFFDQDKMSEWYQKAEQGVNQEVIPAEFRNKNAQIFADGFKANGFECAPLNRAQKNCRYSEGNDCIECLSGCKIDSKQSMLITYIKESLKQGLKLLSKFEVDQIEDKGDKVLVHGRHYKSQRKSFSCRKLVLAAGAIGNSKLLQNSNWKLPAIGHHFYTHPQFMVLGEFKEDILAHKGPFQAMKSADAGFRKKGFKLENVFAPPVGLSMLFKGFGHEHMQLMKRIKKMACIEVAVRDTQPGKISFKKGKLKIIKTLNEEDKKRRNAGIEAIEKIFSSQGAVAIHQGNLPIGLHLMGGCRIGQDDRNSVVNPEFQLHNSKNIFVADSSIFPSAPGINPSLTIMALSKKAAQGMVL
ncbi:MAG: glucose-methanol-choline oxidoreductase [Halobacteriovoraceae bacterium]|nr:glucose-methanol-choline oxidoreductase [Halobacteriovoraceae bacterium]